MNRHLFAVSVLSTAIGLAMAMQAQPTAARAEIQPATEAYIIPLFPQKEGDLKKGLPPGMTAYTFWAAHGTAKLTKQSDGKVVTEFDLEGLIPMASTRCGT